MQLHSPDHNSTILKLGNVSVPLPPHRFHHHHNQNYGDDLSDYYHYECDNDLVIMSMTVVIAGHLDNSPEAREAWSQNKQLSLRLSWLSPCLSPGPTFVFDHFAILRLLCTPRPTWANTPIFLIFPIVIQLCRPGLAMMNCFAIDDENDNDLDNFPALRAPPPPSHHLFPQTRDQAPLHRFTCISITIIITVNITVNIAATIPITMMVLNSHRLHDNVIDPLRTGLESSTK